MRDNPTSASLPRIAHVGRCRYRRAEVPNLDFATSPPFTTSPPGLPARVRERGARTTLDVGLMNAPATYAILPRLLTERQAADALGVSSDTLRRERRRRRIGYVMIGGRPRYTEQHLATYLDAHEVQPCDESTIPTAPVILEITGLVGVPAAPHGAGRGLTPADDKRVEHRSALAILQPLVSRSRSGSPKTSQQTTLRPEISPSGASSLATTSGTANT